MINMEVTDLQICNVEVTALNSSYKITRSSYRIPKDLFIGTDKLLWHFIVDRLREFLNEHGLSKRDKPGP